MSGIIQIYDDVTGVFTKVAFATDRAAVTDVVRFINANLIAGHKAYSGSAVRCAVEQTGRGDRKVGGVSLGRAPDR